MRLVTYNIQYSLGQDGRFDLARVVRAVEGADIIALQEVERFWPRSGLADQPAEIGLLLPDYHWVYGPAFDVDGSERTGEGTLLNRRRQFGPMLLSRTPILSSRLHLLPKMGALEGFNMDTGALEGVIMTGPLADLLTPSQRYCAGGPPAAARPAFCHSRACGRGRRRLDRRA